jgi:tRNA (mo5U34)-methyltransferase
MLDLDKIRQERAKWLCWKNILPVFKRLESLPQPPKSKVELGDVIKIYPPGHYQEENKELIEDVARAMIPWRKGPFQIGDLLIDSEWQSFIKYNLLAPHFNLEGKVVADVGCNNGYYLFRMLSQNPQELVGFDPAPLYYLQFQFIDKFIQSGIKYELLGVEHIEYYEYKFDTIFCLGVLYHRSDPVGTLKSLYRSLNYGGELILDTFMIKGDDEVALTPRGRYSKIPNIYFIPTIKALENWCLRAGFESMEVLAIKKTDTSEQRKTDWIKTQSLENFLNPNNLNETVEGYPAPIRVYIKAKK